MANTNLTTLRLERDRAVMSVILNRPQVHDAFDDVMVAELTEVFRDVGRETSVRVILLRSTGRHFCAGADLNWMRRIAEYSREDNLEDAIRLEAMFDAIATCPKPVVVRVQGAALGGGSGLVAAADIAVASRAAVFGFTEARLGILPAVISPYVLHKLPAGSAQALFLTGSRLDATEALQLGLVNAVVPVEQLDAKVQETIGDLLACSPDSQARIKRLLRLIEHLPAEAAREHTTRAITAARASNDAKVGMAAFLAKKKPPWAGKP